MNKPALGFIKTIKKTDNKGEEYVITFKYSGMTFVYYQNFFGRSLMSDYISSIADGSKLSENKDKILRMNAENLTSEDIELVKDIINPTKFNDFLTNFAAVMYYTAHDGENLSIKDILSDYLPPNFIEDEEIMEAITEILNSGLNEELKKKLNQMKK